MFFVTVYVAWQAGTTTLYAEVNYIPQSGTTNLLTVHISMGYDGIGGISRLSGLSRLNSVAVARPLDYRRRPLAENRKRTLYCLLTNPTSLRWMNGGIHGLINYIDTEAKCHTKKLTCKGTLSQVLS